MLDKEYQYFLGNKKDLIKKYSGKFIVIKGEEVVGVYETLQEALKISAKAYSLGDFLIQHISDKEDDYIQRFHSRVCI